MIIDKRNEFCDATALDTGGTGLALIGNVIDLGAAGRDMGNGTPLYLVIQVDTAVTSNGNATVEFHLVSDAQAAIAVDASATVHAKTADTAKATLVAGYRFVMALPAEYPAYERYLGILQNVGTAALTAGKVNAFLTDHVPNWKATADAL